MERHGYANWRLIDQEVRDMRDAQEHALGKLADGTYECDLVSIDYLPQGKMEVTL